MRSITTFVLHLWRQLRPPPPEPAWARIVRTKAGLPTAHTLVEAGER